MADETSPLIQNAQNGTDQDYSGREAGQDVVETPKSYLAFVSVYNARLGLNN